LFGFEVFGFGSSFAVAMAAAMSAASSPEIRGEIPQRAHRAFGAHVRSSRISTETLTGDLISEESEQTAG